MKMGTAQALPGQRHEHTRVAGKANFQPVFVCFAFLLAWGTGLWLAAQSPVHILIMHTNDLHGQVLPRNGVGGMPQISTLLKNARPDLILDAGDMFTGTVITDEFKGVPIIQAMSRIGYHAAALGNHEFDYGLDPLRLRAREATFPILSANIDTGISDIRKYTVLTVKGVRVGIIGLTTESVRTATHPKNLGGVVIHDVVNSVRDVLPGLRRQVDIILVLSHTARPEEERIASAFPEIRLIVSGHHHDVLGPFWIGQTMVAKTGSSGRNIGRVDMQIQDKRIMQLEGNLIPVTGVAADPEIAALIEPFERKVAEKMNVVLGEAMADLLRDSKGESPLSNLIADAFRIKTNTDVVVQNIGGIRADLRKGPVTWGDAFEVLPFQNTLVTMELSGSQLKEVLARALAAVSGVRIHLDSRKPEGQRLISAVLSDGRPIEDTQTYTITTNDFTAAGGDGFTEFAQGRNMRDTAILLRDALVDYIQMQRVISPILDGRVRVN